MNKSLFFFAQLFVLIIIQNNKIYSQKHELYIEFNLEKTEYVEDEPVIINCKVTNTGTFTEYISYNCNILMDIYESMKILNENGKQFNYHSAVIDCFGGLEKLDTGECLQNYMNNELEFGIELGFGFGDSSSYSLPLSRYFSKGRYKIIFDKWVNTSATIRTNLAEFEIKKAGENEGYDRFKEICRMHDGKEKYDSIQSYLYNYPNSAYFDRAVQNYLAQVKWGTRDFKVFSKVLNYCLSNNNNSVLIYDILSSAAIAIKYYWDEDNIKDYMISVIKKNKDSKAENAARFILNQRFPNDLYIKWLLNQE